MKLNINTILLLLGGLATIGPDLTGLAAWLSNIHVGWMVHVVHVLAWGATACGALAIALPKARAFLAALGLATAPGTKAPWIPGKPGDPDLAATKASADLASEAPTPIKGNPIVRPKDKGAGRLPLWAIVGIAAGLVCLLAALARADTPTPSTGIGCFDAANSYCLVPAAAVGWQINLQDGSTGNAVSLVGLVLQHQFGSLPLGLGLYGGFGESTKNQGSLQGCLGLSITSWGLLCGGTQRAKFPDGLTAWQAMLTFAPQLTYGGSPSALKAAAKAGQ